MGMKGLGGWIAEEFPAAHQPQLDQYDHVLVDVAPLLYGAIIARKGELLQAPFLTLTNLISCNSLYLQLVEKRPRFVERMTRVHAAVCMQSALRT